MSKFEDDLARGCLPTGEPLECLYGTGWWTEMPEEEPEPDPVDLHIAELEDRIAELETESAELKPYRDGYDACENFPEEGVNVIAVAARDNWFLLAQRRGDKWYDSLGQQAEIRGGIERWWKLPEVQE